MAEQEVLVKPSQSSDQPKSPPGSRDWIGFGILGSLFTLILILYMGLWRGIWFDELLHFALGGMTFEYVIKTIDYTTMHVNHGQTGVYFLLDWILLQITGASATALRLPSLVSGFVLLVSSSLFLRAKGFSWRWQAVALAALGANESLMFYTGEARPYMPLAASAVAMLAFYALPASDRRKWWGWCLGLFGFIFGATIHPYWAVMWGLVAFFSVAVTPGSGIWPFEWSRLLRFVAPVYVSVGLVLYLTIGQLTWMRRIINFGWPDSIYSWGSLWNALVQGHYSYAPFIYPNRVGTGEVSAGAIVPLVAGALALITLVWLLVASRTRSQRLVPPIALGGIALASSLFFSYLSYRSQYIIF